MLSACMQDKGGKFLQPGHCQTECNLDSSTTLGATQASRNVNPRAWLFDVEQLAILHLCIYECSQVAFRSQVRLANKA